MSKALPRKELILLLTAFLTANIALSQTTSKATNGSGTTPSPNGEEPKTFQLPPLLRETTVQITEHEQQILEKQRETIKRNDKKRAKADKTKRESYSITDNAIIASNYKQFKGIAEGEKSKYKSNMDSALERIKKIENMKREIIRFERYYDEGSEEVASLLSSLEDYYAELERDSYTVSTFTGELTVRGEDYREAEDGWKITVYSELFGLASLFRYGGLVGYKDMVKKGGSLLGGKALVGLKKEDCIKVIDSLFARACPVTFATLEFKILRGINPSQYRLVPIQLTLSRTDNLKVVLSAGKESMPTGSFYMDPQFEVVPASATAQQASQAQEEPRKKKAGKTAKPEDSEPEPDASGTSGNKATSNAFLNKMLYKQKKRRALFATADTAIFSLADYDIRDLELNSIKLNFEFANNEYFFYGGGLSWRYAGRNSESFYGTFINAGANITLFRNFRPYILVEGSANTGAELGLGIGTGIDFTIKHLILNLNGSFNWSFDADSKSDSKSSTFATVGMGIGFTW